MSASSAQCVADTCRGKYGTWDACRYDADGLFIRTWPAPRGEDDGEAPSPAETKCSRRGYAHRELVCDRHHEINMLVEMLRNAWLSTPELRLGQLVVNVAKRADPFYVDDVTLAASLCMWAVSRG